ncbi:MAG: hypothetical protein ACI8RD_001006 [Bacillariaceae sp.]|jgi:hypothetical protein
MFYFVIVVNVIIYIRYTLLLFVYVVNDLNYVMYFSQTKIITIFRNKTAYQICHRNMLKQVKHQSVLFPVV